MKVRQCDICGITDKEIREEGICVSMNHFKVSSVLGVLIGNKDFDLCGDCLKEIEMRRIEIRMSEERRSK